MAQKKTITEIRELLQAEEVEAQLMADSLRDDFGVDVRWKEEQSRTTWENAQMTADILLAQGIKRVVVVMEHEAKGESKLLKACNLPFTGTRVVDMVITDLGVFAIDKHNLGPMKLIEMAPGVTLDEIKAKTDAEFVSAL